MFLCTPTSTLDEQKCTLFRRKLSVLRKALKDVCTRLGNIPVFIEKSLSVKCVVILMKMGEHPELLKMYRHGF